MESVGSTYELLALCAPLTDTLSIPVRHVKEVHVRNISVVSFHQ